MLSDLTIFVNTHSSASDCWPMFFGQLAKHWPSHPLVVFAHDIGFADGPCDDFIPHNAGNPIIVDYSSAKKFSNQYLMGLCAVETPYVLTLQEDFILYDDVRDVLLQDAMDGMNAENAACSRLIDSGRDLMYSMQATIWRTQALRQLYTTFEAETPWNAESLGSVSLNQLGWRCGQRRDDLLPMRGRDHRDSKVFPYIATAIVKGKWNADYRAELEPLHKEYGIDAAQRGWTE